MDIHLVLLKSNGVEKAFPLTSSVTVVGRRHDCDLRIPLPTVSRKHCQLTLNDDSVEVRDLNSKWGTFVNDQQVNGKTMLQAGDCIRIGPLKLFCRIDGEPEKFAPPAKPSQKAPKPQKKEAAAPQKKEAAKPAGDEVDDSFADLDASDSFIELNESDSGLEDLKDL